MRSRESAPARSGSEPTLVEILNEAERLSAGCEPAVHYPIPTVPIPTQCALCVAVTNSVVRALKSFFAEFVNDPKSRMALRASRGFCRNHVSLLHATGDALGIAILYSDLAEAALTRWSIDSPPKRHKLIGRSSARLEQCPGCAIESEANSRYSGALAAGLRDESVWTAVSECLSLCTAHVEQVASLAIPEHAERLYAIEAAKLELLRDELNEIIRKNDYRYRSEEWGAERNAWIRALGLVTQPNKLT